MQYEDRVMGVPADGVCGCTNSGLHIWEGKLCCQCGVERATARPTIDDDSECFETLDDLRRDLEAVERTLGARLGIGENIRAALIVLTRAGRLDEDELVSRWLELYSNYADWERSEAGVSRGMPDFTSPILLDEKQWEKFVEILESPPEPTEALKALMRRHG